MIRLNDFSMQEDIRDRPHLNHDDIVGLNFIRNPGFYFYRRHYRAGLRSHIMEVLNPEFLQKEKDFYLLDIKLHTGRKNQIRVHLAQIGCPIVGDRKYGANDSVKRQVRLAACKLEFTHPVSGKNMLLEYHPHKKFFNPSLKEDENYKIV